MSPQSFREIIGLSKSTIDINAKTALLVIDAQGTYAKGGKLGSFQLETFTIPSEISNSVDSSTLRVSPRLRCTDAHQLEITGIDAAQVQIDIAVQKFRSAQKPVIWIQHSAGAGAPIFNPENASFDFIGSTRPLDGEQIIIKAAPSSFTGTDLDSMLKNGKVTQIVLVGYMVSLLAISSFLFFDRSLQAHVCVSGTARAYVDSLTVTIPFTS